jgi:hypothetical protein
MRADSAQARQEADERLEIQEVKQAILFEKI